MLNGLWLGMVVLAVLIGAAAGRLREVTEGAFVMADTAVMKIALPLAGVMALWLGLMRVAEKGGVTDLIAKIVGPLFMRLFPGIPPGHAASGAIVMNRSANMLGLDNAARDARALARPVRKAAVAHGRVRDAGGSPDLCAVDRELPHELVERPAGCRTRSAAPSPAL